MNRKRKLNEARKEGEAGEIKNEKKFLLNFMTRYSSLNAITHARRHHPTSIIRQKHCDLLPDYISFDLFFQLGIKLYWFIETWWLSSGRCRTR